MSVASLTHDRTALLDFLAANAPLLVLTGAGVSSGCGIPTYRDESGRWLRSEPITHQEFVGTPRQRQRYWGRSTIGWPAVRDAQPSRAHRALCALQRQGMVGDIVTQNVDRLHQKAGSHAVIDLHGRLDRVRCLECGADACRDGLQQELLALNPWLDRATGEARPDGDASLQEDEVDRVKVADCSRCGGVLMPDVVFFGGSIPRPRIEACESALRRARGLLVIGSSLQVYSGFRFCRWAAADGKPIALLNPGKSRGDALAALKLSGLADELLPQLEEVAGDERTANCLDTGS